MFDELSDVEKIRAVAKRDVMQILRDGEEEEEHEESYVEPFLSPYGMVWAFLKASFATHGVVSFFRSMMRCWKNEGSSMSRWKSET